MLKVNETLVNPELGSTLEKIAEDPMSFYHGAIADRIVRDIQDAGGIITQSDMRNYNAGRAKALQVSLDNKHKIWTSHPPSSGPVLAMILQILKGNTTANGCGHKMTANDCRVSKHHVYDQT